MVEYVCSYNNVEEVFGHICSGHYVYDLSECVKVRSFGPNVFYLPLKSSLTVTF